VYLLFKRNINLSISQVVLLPEFSCIEVVVIDVCDSVSLPYRISVANRPPNYSSFENELFFSALNYLANNCVRCCLLGDSNLPDFNWDVYLS